MNLPKLSIEIPPADLAALQSHFEAQWLESIRPKPNEYGLRYLPLSHRAVNYSFHLHKLGADKRKRKTRVQ